MKKVSVIIPNLNGLSLLKICLPSLLKQSFRNIEIILVDNGSTDNSVKFVIGKFPGVKIIKLSKNLGFSRAVNKGIKISKGNLIFLLNNDTEIEKDCIKYLVKAAEKADVGFVQAKILNFYDRDKIDSLGDEIDIVGHLYSTGFGKMDGEGFKIGKYIFAGSGGGTLFKNEVFEKVGLFDEDYFFYYEDIDLSFRAQIAGFKGWLEPKAKIYHMRMGTSSRIKNSLEPIIFREMTETIIKNYPLKLIFKNLNFLRIMLVHLNTIRYLILKGYLLDVVKNEWYLISSLGKILKKR